MNEDIQHQIDEHLEALWLCREEGNEGDVETVLARTSGGGHHEVLETMQARGLVELHGGRVEWTATGEEAAKVLIRRHRLAERLLADVLGVTGRDMNEAACGFEHILSPEVTESICTLLGHPPTCPHGLSIPTGPCCRKGVQAAKPVVARLDHLGVGERGVVSMIASRSPDRLRRLGTLGLLPGAEVKLMQKRPAYVVDIGETTLALEKEIAGQIYLKRNGGR
jgi:DtxR family Mn-dependent transcriptional regulator